MVSPLSYSSNPADGGILYLDGLTAEKDQRIFVVGFNDLLISPDDIDILESRPSSTDEKKSQKREARKIAYDIAAQFNTRADMNRKCVNKYMGVVLSFPDCEREILEPNPQMMEDIVNDWLDGMGFDDAQYLAVYHYDTAQPHIHLYVGMVGPDLKAYKSFQTKFRSQQVNREIEKKYGLKSGVGIDKAYKTDIDRTNPKNKVRVEIYKAIQNCLDSYVPSSECLMSYLESKGIRMEEVSHKNGKKGYVFAKDGVSFAGGAIGRSFTYGNITRQLGENASKLESFSRLAARIGIHAIRFSRVSHKEFDTETNKTKAQHRRSYADFGPEALAIASNGDKYAIYSSGTALYISEAPLKSNQQIRNVSWVCDDGSKVNYLEMIKATQRSHMRSGSTDVKKPTTVTRSVSRNDNGPLLAPGFVPVGNTVRDNKSAANTGSDTLDDIEEIVDEDGNKKIVKKPKNKIIKI